MSFEMLKKKIRALIASVNHYRFFHYKKKKPLKRNPRTKTTPACSVQSEPWQRRAKLFLMLVGEVWRN